MVLDAVERKPWRKPRVVEVETPHEVGVQANTAPEPVESLPSQSPAPPVIERQKSDQAVPVVPKTVSDVPTERLVVEAVVENRLVVVAFVVVELTAVKFWRVVEPTTRRSPAWFTENLVDEATFKSRRLPVKPVSASAPITVPVELRCSTESLAYGEVVPMPRRPVDISIVTFVTVRRLAVDNDE